ncbi:MAG: monovalent cation/H+ antiporter subunit D family protein [Gammaproteobacteria bacterium]|nr:monovalent cation/H+ antiporter subunit D family protein [Gammaproteobacteria bacterium]
MDSLIPALENHLPILQVIVPLLIAPFCMILGSRRLARGIMVLTAGIMLAITLGLASLTLQQPVITYDLGGWAAPWGIEYRVDMLTVFILFTINLVHMLASVFCLGRQDGNLGTAARPAFYTAWLLCIAGLNGMVVTNDAFNVFVFLEISSLATYTLISCGREPLALLSAFRYLVAGAVGATFILLSIGLLYMQTGTLNISDLSRVIAERGSDRTIILALAFFIIGVGVKCAVFPLHDWLPNAYRFAPDSVTVLLSGTATKVALYVLIRFLHDLFGADFGFAEMPLDMVLVVTAIFGLLLVPFIALRESNLKRMFAWSSVAQVSYIVMGIGLGTRLGIEAAVLHLFNHAIVKTAIFMAVGIIIARTGTARIKHLGGMAHRHRFASCIMLFGGLSLIGLPGTVGFVSKWVLVTAVVDKGWWWLAIPILAGSLASAAYVWRIVEIMWTKPAVLKPEAPAARLHWVEWLPLSVLAGLALWFGLNASLITGLASSAALGLLNPGG